MVVTLSEALRVGQHALGNAELSPGLDAVGLVSQAGEYLYSMNPWHFTKRRSSLVDLRGQITVTNGTWTEASLVLTATNAFATYTHVEGDTFEVTAGTNANTGFYTVASRTDDDDIVLSSSIGSAADGDTDIGGTLRLNSTALPDDFRSIISIESTDSLIRGVHLTSLEELLRTRTTQLDVATDWDYIAAITYAGGPPPVPILEIWPTPSLNEAGALTVWYRKRFTRPTSDTDILDFPEFIDHLFLNIVRAFFAGWERDDVEPLETKLQRISQGPELKAAIASDASLQWNRGRITGGGAQIHGRRYRRSRVIPTPWRITSPS